MIDYNTGKCLENKNKYGVTVTEEWKWGNPTYYFETGDSFSDYYDVPGDLGGHIWVSNGYGKVNVTYPKNYTGLCVGVGGCIVVSPTKKDTNYFKGKGLFGDTHYQSRKYKNMSHFMRVNYTKADLGKSTQSISAKSVNKVYRNRPFSLGAAAKGKLNYKSGNKNVAAVNSKGKVTLTGPGRTTIAVTAAPTSKYLKATKNITITVSPKKVASLKASAGKKKMSVSWKKTSKVSGYQIVYAQNSKFTKGMKAVNVNYKTSKKTISKLTSKKTYYVKVRAYKMVGKSKIYGSYSSAKKVKVR